MKEMWVGYNVGCTVGFHLGHSAWQIDQFPTCWPMNGLFVHWSRGWGVSSFSERLVLRLLKSPRGQWVDMICMTCISWDGATRASFIITFSIRENFNLSCLITASADILDYFVIRLIWLEDCIVSILISQWSVLATELQTYTETEWRICMCLAPSHYLKQ